MRQTEINKLFGITHKSVSAFCEKHCGQHLGSGLYRDVYVFKQDHKYVVKIERDMTTGAFANVTEWRNWINNKDWEAFSKWLAPCTSINETGQILIQRRVKRVIDGMKIIYPEKIPSLFTDTKKFNFGLLNGRLVCCDYSFLVNCNFRMKKAKWW